jgi:endonuclease/exonuclease/phosphatase family metal-dependent hydrolase
VYEAHSCSFFTFLNNFQTLIQHSPEHCPIIIMGDFNVDILKDNNQTKKNQELLNFMAKFQFKSQFKFSQTNLYCIQITKHTSNV